MSRRSARRSRRVFPELLDRRDRGHLARSEDVFLSFLAGLVLGAVGTMILASQSAGQPALPERRSTPLGMLVSRN